MTRILLIATIVFSIASALFAFLTKEKATELTERLTVAVTSSTALKSDNAKLKEEKKSTAEKIGELSKEASSAKEQMESLRTESASKQTELTTLQQKTQEATVVIAQLKKQIEEAAQNPVPTKDPALEQKLASLQEDLAKKEQKAAEEKARLAQELQQAKAKLAEAAKVKNPENSSAAGQAESASTGSGGGATNQGAPSKRPPSGTVVAYNEGWNFVVVNLGDKAGVTPESKLVIFREGKVIAKLKITEVQPTHTSASLVYPETRRREAVQPGDLVMFAKPELSGGELTPNLRASIP